jgi:hypothetical protein
MEPVSFMAEPYPKDPDRETFDLPVCEVALAVGIGFYAE